VKRLDKCKLTLRQPFKKWPFFVVVLSSIEALSKTKQKFKKFAIMTVLQNFLLYIDFFCLSPTFYDQLLRAQIPKEQKRLTA